jgi:NAD+ synthase (glutamine-hydrolysing)
MIMPVKPVLRVALAQVNLTVGDIEGNQRKIIAWIARAKKAGADVVAFPELAVAGYPAEDLLLKREFLRDCLESIGAIAPHARGIVAVVGFPRLDDSTQSPVARPAHGLAHGEARGSVRNSAAVLAGGKLAALIDKIYLPNYGVFDEKRYFVPGGAAAVLAMGRSKRRGKGGRAGGRMGGKVAGVKVGVSICEDIWQEGVAKAQAGGGGARVLLNISCSPYHAGKGCERENLMRERALANDVFVAYLNLVGGQDELVFDGHSVIIDPNGNVVARGKQFREDLVIADLEIPDGGRARRAAGGARLGAPLGGESAAIPVKTVAVEHAFGAHRPTVGGTVNGTTSRTAAGVPARVPEPMDRLEEIYAAITLGTRDYVLKNGFKKVVIGLSGGIDSALVAAVAVDALGRGGVVGVSMPSRYSSPGSITDARKLARNLGIKLLRVGIEDVFKACLKTLRGVFAGAPRDVTEENIQARIRGNFLMALSNKFGWLVLTTGNKSELAMGYCTLYGDLAGGFAILKDVPKTLVYELAAYKNALGKPLIPRATFTKPPSAELRPDQKDEDSLPPYSVLDPVLEMYVVDEMTVDEIVAAGYKRPMVQRVARLVDGNEYKRRQGPPGIKITPKAFGKDRRMPLTNRYR